MKSHLMKAMFFAVCIGGFAMFAWQYPGTINTQADDTDETDGENEFFEAQLKYAAENYRRFGRADESKLYWSPYACAAPMDLDQLKPGKARFSESEDESTHGGKVYFPFVKDRDSYLQRKHKQPYGQIIVKESWTSKKMKEGFVPDPKKHKVDRDILGEKTVDVESLGWHYGGHIPYAYRDGSWFKADEKMDLFIMIKLAPETKGTDQGWIYGTVNPDGKVTSSGRVQSCIDCHQSDTWDRVFGLPKPKKLNTGNEPNSPRNANSNEDN